jgi:signal recognition particle subunit SRP54
MFDTLSEKFSDAFRNIQGKGKISEDNIEQTLKEVRTALLEADVNFKVVKDFTARVKEKALGEKVLKGVKPGEQFVKIVHDELSQMMGAESAELTFEGQDLGVVLVVGLNGQGKTTFSGKLARHLTLKKDKKVLLVPADTFRPAAKAQLQTLARQVEVECFDSDLNQHPKEIAREAIKYAREHKLNLVIIDTAGRLHVDQELMGQIAEVRESLKDVKPEVLLVADAMTGQEAVNVAKSFHETVGLTGVVLSKMDSDARGGAALSIRYVSGVPIRYISTGEKMKDLELFHPDRLAGRILDMGDVVSLVEKAEENIDKNEAERMMKNLEKGRFTVDDFMKQMEMISSLGSMGSLLKMIPGMGGMMRQVGDLGGAEDEMKRMKVIINSMTKAERQNYKLIKESRLKRIARGSGHPDTAVKDFIAKFQQMEKMMGGMMAMMKGGGMPGMPAVGGQKLPPGGAGFPGMGGKTKKPRKKGGPWGGGYF